MIDEAYDRAFQGARTPLYRSLRQLLVRPKIEDAGPDADAAAEAMRLRIRETKDLVPTLRLLGREGFAITDAKTFATVASVHNAGLFRAGAVLVGATANSAMPRQGL